MSHTQNITKKKKKPREVADHKNKFFVNKW